jgi:hypothetical protein
MLDLMVELLETGESSYQNPFGEDDTEAFDELPEKQQRTLLAVAKTCASRKAPP